MKINQNGSHNDSTGVANAIEGNSSARKFVKKKIKADESQRASSLNGNNRNQTASTTPTTALLHRLKNFIMTFDIMVVVTLLTINKFSFVHAILNDGTPLLATTPVVPSLTLPIFEEGQTHHQNLHAKVSTRTETTAITASQKRRFPLPLPATTALPLLGACECMAYWECISNNGYVYSYCGINDSEVCCFQNENRVPEDSRNNRDHKSENNTVKPSVQHGTPIAATVQPESVEVGNNEPTTTDDGNIFTTSSLHSEPESTTPDVDYYYSLEDGVGDLKQITAVTAKNIERIAKTSGSGRNDSGFPCGTQIINWEFNSKAEFKEWPWHVALLEINQDVYICGGSIINQFTVITAGHCVNSYGRRAASTLKIRAGEYDVSTNDETDPYTEVAVEKIFIHPSFNNATLSNDIALVKLKQPLNYTSNIRPICLPDESLRSHNPRNCVVTGFGRQTESSPFSIVLKEIIVPLWGHEECEDKLQNNFGTSYELAGTSICAGERGHDACDGDGGGGLVCFDEQQDRFYIKGITSYGIGCGRLDTPGVYTNVASYLPWIESFHYLLAV